MTQLGDMNTIQELMALTKEQTRLEMERTRIEEATLEEKRKLRESEEKTASLLSTIHDSISTLISSTTTISAETSRISDTLSLCVELLRVLATTSDISADKKINDTLQSLLIRLTDKQNHASGVVVHTHGGSSSNVSSSGDMSISSDRDINLKG